MHGSHDHSPHRDHSSDHLSSPSLAQRGSSVINTRSLSLFGRTVQTLRQPLLRGLLAAVLLLLPLAAQRRLRSSNYALIACASAFSLAVFDDLKKQTRVWMSKVKVLQSSLLKHSSPLTREYFFKNNNAADRVTLLGVWINVFLSVVKFFGGLYFRSAVLVADAGHSLSDLFSDFITLWAVQMARLPPDDDHPYGHGKFESIGSLFLSLTLLGTGLGVASWSYEQMQAVLSAQGRGASGRLNMTPSWQALCLAAVSIASKEWLFRVTKKVGDALNSQVVIANAWHHRSDAFSSILSLVSIALAISLPQFLVVDSACGLFIAGMIVLTGLEILMESIKQLSDSSDETITSEVSRISTSIDGVLDVQRVRARNVGNGHLIDLKVLTDSKISTSAANVMAEKVRWAIMERMPQAIDVLVRTQSSQVVCPLLMQTQRTPAEIEKSVRAVLSASDDVEDVSRVTVHFLEDGKISIEAIVRSSLASSVSVANLRQTAAKLRSKLMTDDREITHADILLAL